MKVLLTDGTTLEMTSDEYKEVFKSVKVFSEKSPVVVHHKRRYQRGKCCRICKVGLPKFKKKLCGNPECVRKWVNKKHRIYLRKRRVKVEVNNQLI